MPSAIIAAQITPRSRTIVHHIKSFIKYIIVGGSAALINWAVFYVCLNLSMHYLAACVVSFVLATLWNFLLARHFIFHTRTHSLLKESMLVYIASLCALLIDMMVVWGCVEWLDMQPMLGKIIATGVAFVFNFLARYLLIYKSHTQIKPNA